MDSFYTENTNLTPYHRDWLDGCGATWRASKEKFSLGLPLEARLILFTNFMANSHEFQWRSGEEFDSRPLHTHCTTGDQFCSEIAKILGTTFEPEKSEPKEEPKIAPRKHGSSALPASPVYLHEGGPSSNSVPIKGMAIEVSRLSEDEKEYIYSIYRPTYLRWKYCVFCFINSPDGITFSGDDYIKDIEATITDSPKVFMEYVAQQTRKEYKPGIASEKEIAEMLEKMEPDISDGPSFGDIAKALGKSDDSYKFKNYPHKTYRILDSLDGIPLDTRFSLSEWIPPFGEEIAIIGSKRLFGRLWYIENDGYVFIQSETGSNILVTDGEWMRIV